MWGQHQWRGIPYESLLSEMEMPVNAFSLEYEHISGTSLGQ